ncbi:MAG: hypothetical protein KatS3mg076_3240 [Candidatus Binatia bacterium]|nr:MAG: hypothetical protein KatS3mg076_3240 [Candidatus Binatia bacterium]
MAEPRRGAKKRRLEWRRAWKALGILVADPKRTEQVFEIVRALSGPGSERAFRRFASHPEGQKLLRERPSLLEALSNREALRKLPPGSFGRAYADFMDRCNLSAEELVEADLRARTWHDPAEDDPDRAYFGARLRDAHDLWHVLTGYGMDEAGEAANLAFSFAQVPNLGIGLIVLTAAVIGPKSGWFRWQRYLFRAWLRGKRARLLSVARYEDLLPLPLEEVRRRLGIEPPEKAHPEGIIVAGPSGTRAANATA